MNWLKKHKEPIVIHTDGACSKKGHGGWAAIIREGTVRIVLAGSTTETTNNRMELTAVIKALKAVPEYSNIFIHSDSKYVLQGIQYSIHRWKENGWKTLADTPVVNVDLWQELAALAEGHTISWLWVAGHSGDIWNEKCDQLALRASQLQHGDIVHMSEEGEYLT